MAVHHPATIAPTKLELLQAWVPHQPWTGNADTSVLTKLGSYRFDDPDGEVGMETHLLATADGQVLQVPLTYRGVPRTGAEDSLITTMTHTTLGQRWIYDGCHDPIYVNALVTTIVTGGREADLYAATEQGMVLEPATTHVRGSGSAATVPGLTTPVVSHEGTTTISAGVDFQKRNGVTYPSILDTDGQAALALRGFAPNATPVTLVLDPQGRVAAQVAGEVESSVLDGLIEDVLAETTATSVVPTSPSAV